MCLPAWTSYVKCALAHHMKCSANMPEQCEQLSRPCLGLRHARVKRTSLIMFASFNLLSNRSTQAQARSQHRHKSQTSAVPGLVST